MQGSYFEGKCANCHVEQGIGKMGRVLFDADCAMCHGAGAKGVSDLTFPLSGQGYLSSITDQELYGKIAAGTDNPMMLGFSKKNHGPLDEKQIKSLVEYIRGLRNSEPKDQSN